MADEKALRDIAIMLKDHEERITMLEEAGNGDTDGLPGDGWEPGGDGDSGLPDRPERPDAPSGDVAFEWTWNGSMSAFNLILEPSGQPGCGTVEQKQGYVRARAEPPRSGTTVKACGEVKHAYVPKVGQIIEVKLDLELQDCRSAAELYLIDLETSDRSSSGTRLKINEGWCWRIDGGKLGFDSQNDEQGRTTQQYQIPRGRRFEATIRVKVSADDDAWVTVDHDGVEVFKVTDIPTIPRDGKANKFQALITALGDPQADTITLDTYGIVYRVLDE